MRAMFDILAKRATPIPERLVARTANSSAERDTIEVEAITLADDDSQARCTLCIELFGDASHIEAGEKWDIYLMHRMTNPNASSNPSPIIWWHEVRLADNDGHNRSGDRLIFDQRTLRITKNPDPSGGSLHHGMVESRAVIEFPTELPGVAARYIKAINWCTPAGGEASPHGRGYLRVLRYRPGDLL